MAYLTKPAQWLGVSLLVLNVAWARDEAIQPLQSTIVEEKFQTLIVNKALEELGYKVNPTKEVDYNVAFTSIANGDATFMAAHWLPLQADKFANAGGEAKLYRQGTFVDGAVQGYMIDKKTADEYNITNLAQLKDPKLAKLFDIDGNGKADLTGCSPGWSCEHAVNQHIDGYGLTETVEQNQGNYAALIANTLAHYRSGKPVLYYTWTPYWVSGVLQPGKDVVWLQLPTKPNAGKTVIHTNLSNGKNYGFPMSSMHILANKTFTDTHPDVAKLFAIMQIPVGDISAQNMAMRNGQDSPKDIERHADAWIKHHRAQFDNWLAQARAAKK